MAKTRNPRVVALRRLEVPHVDGNLIYPVGAVTEDFGPERAAALISRGSARMAEDDERITHTFSADAGSVKTKTGRQDAAGAGQEPEVETTPEETQAEAEPSVEGPGQSDLLDKE